MLYLLIHDYTKLKVQDVAKRMNRHTKISIYFHCTNKPYHLFSVVIEISQTNCLPLQYKYIAIFFCYALHLHMGVRQP